MKGIEKAVKHQSKKIEIYFNFIGNYEPPKEELTEEERLKIEEEERYQGKKRQASLKLFKA